MERPASAPARYRFGTFELDRSAAELRKRGILIRLQEQPYRILCLLLDNPNEVITRETLSTALWPEDTFVEFERSLNAAVAKLRQALGDSAENPRFVETLARRGYRFIAPVEITPGESNVTPLPANTNVPAVSLVQEISTRPATLAAKPGIRTRSVLAIALVAVAMLAVVGFWFWSPRFWHTAHRDQPTLIQLTSGTGLTMEPAVSPDGKLLAYASDRADGRNLNIWIQQLAPAGTAVQLTHFASDTTEPSFSPDGSRIVFHSTENGGGIYAIPTIGGEPTRLVPGGRNPHFSPDGKWIAYWTGTPWKTVVTGGGGGDIYVVPASGGEPRRLAADLSYAGNPVWSPNSRNLMVSFQTVSNEFAWSVISLNGEPSIRTTIFESLKQQGFSIGWNRIPRLSQWTPGFILFSAVYGDAFNVWRMPVSDDGRSLGHAERLTSGTTLEASGLLASPGNLVFASLNLVQSIWSIPLDADHAKLTGELKKLTDGPSEAEPAISLDGRKLAFVVNQKANLSELRTPDQRSMFQVRVKDLSTGKEASIPDVKHQQQFEPQFSRDGTLLAFTTDDERIQIFASEPLRMLVETEKGEGRKIWDWSADNKRLLHFGKCCQPYIYSYDVSSGRDSVFLSGDGWFQTKFSPDNRAVVMVACSQSVGCRLFVVPLKSDGTPEKDHWIAIDHPSRWDDKPRWSPDGNLIYFVSDRDGQFCLWAQRVENRTKRPIGTPFAVYHFHDSRLAMDNVGTSFLEIGVARDKIVMDLGELTGNIWSLKQ